MSGGFGYLIKQARLDRGWTHADLAKRLGIARGYVASLESDKIKRPGPDLMLKIESVLGISREELMRAVGMIGPAPSGDPYEIFRLLRDLPSDEARVAAVVSMPPEVAEAIDVLVQSLIREGRRARQRS